MENKPDKGLKGGSCNVTRCQKPEAWVYNKSTKAYYCKSCASDINWEGGRAETMELFGVPLLCEERCILVGVQFGNDPYMICNRPNERQVYNKHNNDYDKMLLQAGKEIDEAVNTVAVKEKRVKIRFIKSITIKGKEYFNVSSIPEDVFKGTFGDLFVDEDDGTKCKSLFSDKVDSVQYLDNKYIDNDVKIKSTDMSK